MIRIDPYYFYQVGAALRPLKSIKAESTSFDALMTLYGARNWLDSLLGQTVVRLRTCAPKGYALRKVVDDAAEEIANTAKGKDKWDLPIGHNQVYAITAAAEAFETLFSGEMQFADLYYVTKKGGFDTTELTENGIVIFPSELPIKVPEAILDARAAARCIAFELPTAAAFHLHRLNEYVLRSYYDFITGRKPRPEARNIGAYIDAMKGYQVGDKLIFSALSNVARFHRNPVLHPEQTLDTVEDAIALHGTINTVVIYMLKALPQASLKLIPPPTNEPKEIENKT